MGAPAVSNRPLVPVEVYIEPTNRCNELCQTCPRTFVQREPEADLDLERFRRVLDQFPDVERVVLGPGQGGKEGGGHGRASR